MMLKLSAAFLLTGSVSLALADTCTDIQDDSSRLECYDAVRACTQIDTDADRLVCFDAAFAVEQAIQAEGEAGQASAKKPVADIVTREDEIAAREAELAAREAELAAREAAVAQQQATAEVESEEEFGKRWKEDDEPMDFIEATIVQLESNPFKVDYLRLDNGQVWREISDSGLRFEVGDKIIITEGILGSFDLQVETSSRYVKVKRLK